MLVVVKTILNNCLCSRMYLAPNFISEMNEIGSSEVNSCLTTVGIDKANMAAIKKPVLLIANGRNIAIAYKKPLMGVPTKP